MTTQHPPVGLPEGFPPDFATTPLFPSSMFGGIHDEMWTPEDMGSLLGGWYLLNEGVGLLSGLVEAPNGLGVHERTDLVTSALEWITGVTQWVQETRDKIKATSDFGVTLMDVQTNMLFIADGVTEHVNRLRN
jgi:hypothetical protein